VEVIRGLGRTGPHRAAPGCADSIAAVRAQEIMAKVLSSLDGDEFLIGRRWH